MSECPSNPARKGRPGPGSCSWRAAGWQGRREGGERSVRSQAGPGCTLGWAGPEQSVLGHSVAKTGLKFTTGTRREIVEAYPVAMRDTGVTSHGTRDPHFPAGTLVCCWHSCITAMGRLPMQMAVCRGAAAQGREGRLHRAGRHAGP